MAISAKWKDALQLNKRVGMRKKLNVLKNTSLSLMGSYPAGGRKDKDFLKNITQRIETF